MTVLEQIEDLHNQDITEEAQKEENRKNLKALLKYQKGDFSEVVQFCNQAQDALKSDLYEEIEARTECVVKHSQVTERMMYKLVLEKVAEKVTCDVYKSFLLDRAKAHETYIENMAGADAPIYTDLDLVKFQRQEYYNIATHYIEFCIEKLEEKKPEERKEVY